MWSNLFTKQRTDAIVKSSEFMEAKRLEDLALKNALGIVIPENIEDSTDQEQRNNVLSKNTGKGWDPLLEHLMQRFGYKKLRSILKTDKHCDINSGQLQNRPGSDSSCSTRWIEVVKNNHSANRNRSVGSSDSTHHKRKRLQRRQHGNKCKKVYPVADEHFHKTDHASRSLSATSSNSELTKKSANRKEGHKSSNVPCSIRNSRSTYIPKHKQVRNKDYKLSKYCDKRHSERDVQETFKRSKQSGNRSNSPPHSCNDSASCRFSNKQSSKLAERNNLMQSSKRDAKRGNYKSHRSHSNNSCDS